MLYVITLPTSLSRDMTPRYRLVTRWCGIISEENGILNSAFLIFDQENKIFRNFFTQCMGKEPGHFELCHTNHALALPPTCYDNHRNTVIRLPAKRYFYLPGCQLPSDIFPSWLPTKVLRIIIFLITPRVPRNPDHPTAFIL
jgi:hypothetical protein